MQVVTKAIYIEGSLSFEGCQNLQEAIHLHYSFIFTFQSSTCI